MSARDKDEFEKLIREIDPNSPAYSHSPAYSDVFRAVSILRGSDLSYALAWLSFAVSVGFFGYGTFEYEMPGAVGGRKFSGLAALSRRAAGWMAKRSWYLKKLPYSGK